jgi:AsmA protein
VTGAKLLSPGAGSTSLVSGDIALQSATQPQIKGCSHKNKSLRPLSGSTFLLAPTPLALGGKESAILEGHFDASGYTLHLSGMVTSSRLLALGAALPEFGDGLAKALPANHAAGPFRVDLTAVRPRGGVQIWTEAPVRPIARHSHRAKHP